MWPRRSEKSLGAQFARELRSGFSTTQTLTLATSAIIGVYLAVAVTLYLWRGVYFTPDPPDSWALFLMVGAVVLGRWKTFLRDWIPFVALIFGYELLRGFAGTVVTGGELAPAHPGAVRFHWLLSVDSWLFGGEPPTLRLQRALYTPGTTHWWDGLAVLVYSLHFALPLVFAYLLWIRDRERFRFFAVTLLFATYTTFVIFLLYPTAPPWLVHSWGFLPGIHDPFNQAVSSLVPAKHSNFSTITIWTKASPDPVAAFPSLHAAYPWLVLLFLVKFFGKRGWLFLIYNAAVWFSIVYLAQHWVVDIFAGIAWATASFLLVNALWSRMHLGHGDNPVVQRQPAPQER